MKKGILLISLCILLTGCNSTNTDQIQEVDYKEKVIFYERDEKIANNAEFGKGSGIILSNINNENIESLFVLGKVWGFLKYHHPNVAKGEYNWDYELFRVLNEILDIDSTEERDKVLCDWIDSQGDFEVINDSKTNKIPESKVKMSPNLGWISDLNLSEDLKSKLLNIEKAKRASDNFYVSLELGVQNPIFKNEKEYSAMIYPDGGYRLLSLFRYWNIIEYYFPYKNLIEENWDEVLKEFVPKFINASNQLEYKLSVLELIGRIHDTHANIWSNDKTLARYWGENYVFVVIKFIQDKAVVTDYYDIELGKKSGLEIGDVITKINNRLVEDIIEDQCKYIPASNYPTKLRDIGEKILRTNEDKLNIEFIRNDEIKSVDAASYPFSTRKFQDYSDSVGKHKDFYKLIDSDIAYIFPAGLRDRELSEIMSEVEKTKGLIVDLRCYPSEFIVYSLTEYLLPKEIEFTKITSGSISNPGLFSELINLKVGRENEDYYKGKVIILVNEKTQSQAEFTAMALRTAPRATVIGSTTAGADGNLSRFYLPGGILTGISGIGIYYPDGEETQRIGIVPDIEIKPTVLGIKTNKDELLEKAIEIIKH